MKHHDPTGSVSPSMKSARLTLLTTPEFKAFLGAEAARGGISVAELVRSRCEQRPNDDEAVLASLAKELRRAVKAASAALKGGLAEADAVLAELRTAPQAANFSASPQAANSSASPQAAPSSASPQAARSSAAPAAPARRRKAAAASR